MGSSSRKERSWTAAYSVEPGTSYQYAAALQTVDARARAQPMDQPAKPVDWPAKPKDWPAKPEDWPAKARCPEPRV